MIEPGIERRVEDRRRVEVRRPPVAGLGTGAIVVAAAREIVAAAHQARDRRATAVRHETSSFQARPRRGRALAAGTGVIGSPSMLSASECMTAATASDPMQATMVNREIQRRTSCRRASCTKNSDRTARDWRLAPGEAPFRLIRAIRQ